MKYLPLETCKHLVSLGCTSESEMAYVLTGVNRGEYFLYHGEVAEDKHDSDVPAFCLEDLLRTDNAVRIWKETILCLGEFLGKPYWQHMSEFVLWKFQQYPDTWPEEISKLINPKAEEGGENKEG